MYLLDTHAFLWFANDDPKLPENVRNLMESDEIFYISIGSFWEMSIKNSNGKLRLPGSITQMMEYCEQLGFQILPIKASHLEQLKTLPRIHGDPFDRLLICQALDERLVLITTDENIPKYQVKTCWKV